MDEARTLKRARSGDRSALRDLYEAHVERVYALAFRMTGDDEVARDATQEAFLRAFQRLDQFRGDAAFSTWLHAVTSSVVLNVIRKRNVRKEVPIESEEPRSPEFHSSNGASEAVELRVRIRDAIDALPELYRDVFVMHDVEGYTHREIGTALGVAEGTSKARLSTARARLRERLAGVWMDG